MSLITYTNIEDNTPITANVFNQRFGQIISVLNGGLDANNFKAGGIPVDAISQAVYSKMWPVGSIYMNASDNTNPATLFGFGTWEAFGAGRVPVGYDETQTEFNAVNKTGGHKALASHNHSGTTSANGNHTHGFTADAVRTSGGGTQRTYLGGGSGQQLQWNGTLGLSTEGNHNHTFVTANAGSGNSGNLQPYVTVYMWRRTG